MQALTLIVALLHSILAFFRSHKEQAIVELALRQQLATYALTRPKPRLAPLDRAFWVALRHLWPRWKEVQLFGLRVTAANLRRNSIREAADGGASIHVVTHALHPGELVIVQWTLLECVADFADVLRVCRPT